MKGKRWGENTVLVLALLGMLIVPTSLVEGRLANVGVSIGSYEDYFLRIVTTEPTVRAAPGETVEFMLYVRRGDSDEAVHDVQIKGADDRFTLTVEPESIPRIRNVDMVPVQAALTVPTDTEPGIYPLRITVQGKEFTKEAYPMKVAIKVGPHTNIWRILFLLLTAGIIAIIVWRIINIKSIGEHS